MLRNPQTLVRYLVPRCKRLLRSLCGVCWRYATSLVIPKRLRDASYSLRRGPAISWQNCFHCSVLPGKIGNADASDAIFLVSFSCLMFQGRPFFACPFKCTGKI